MGKIIPPEWEDRDFEADWPANKEAWLAPAAYMALHGNFDDKHLVPDDSPEVDVLWRYLGDVKADLAAKGIGPKAKTARNQRRRPEREPSSLTPKQSEAVAKFAECYGNVSKAAKLMGVVRKTFRQHLEAACAKLGVSLRAEAAKYRKEAQRKTADLPVDARGQTTVADRDEGPASSALGKGRQVHRDRRGG
jgi:DNA-binding CsgD family transcriptional regulator